MNWLPKLVTELSKLPTHRFYMLLLSSVAIAGIYALRFFQ